MAGIFITAFVTVFIGTALILIIFMQYKKTLREAKLLYKSLTSSLNKRSSKKNLAEGRSTRALGSASKSARSAQPADGAGQLDRWATLAGINQDK